MIPRYQKILLLILLCASLSMAFLLWHLRDRAQKRMMNEAMDDSAVTESAQATPTESATLMAADDNAGILTAQLRSLPLPAENGARARAVLGKLLELYASKESAHPVPGGPAGLTQVFFTPLPPAGSATGVSANPGAPLLAVVNLTSAFAASHPSGVETESLTLLSIAATLKANLPRVEQVRFLVDGAVRPTLAGHADLTRAYLPEPPTAKQD